ncbi:MAG: hypothetical protein J6K01_02555 [Paludibacteraceae bacterium]|nr:hypothetical protein [Paludibacteraceae bacterium]
MELTNLQLMLLIAFNEARIPRNEAAAILTLLSEQEIEQIIDKIIEMDRLPTEQELMNILFPILKAKPTS